ncbi:MAG: undecaprenyldiphospho-muramoylpentapeptide beta-N-acetylglucosaminyltransferase [Bacillota bacterium]|nr:undecaprenyldiphospho-muramoylpentapeptide beta-N-acetylglucosaminyltransferase [Bacillota bacterium]MDW7676472.1 undecaprenyldiphospho-muramoylpentapeptide beta-N-acetylglucosaminyltransferase [Bacillota bacterium]
MRYLLSGGGTGGHIYPAIAIADRIRESDPGAEILFVGAEKGLELDLVPQSGYPIESITVSYLKRKISWHNVKSLGMLMKGLVDAGRILKSFKPDWVIGTGGFVSGPVLYQAAKKGYRTLIHEQNAYPGLTNRILSRYVDVVALSFEDARRYIKRKDHSVVTGNPIRKEYYHLTQQEARKDFPEYKNKNMVLVAGGSGGSAQINQAVEEMLDQYPEMPFRLYWSTGKHYYEQVKKRCFNNAFVSGGHQMVPYIERMPYALKACDLIVSSAGAITIAEVMASDKHAVLIPKAYTAENHQEKNARMMESDGYAAVIREQELNGETLYHHILEGLKGDYQRVEHTKVRPAVDRIWSLLNQNRFEGAE